MMAKENDNQTTTSAKAKKAGFKEDGTPYPGVDPKSGERVTVTLGALKSEFGTKKGEEMFRSIGHVAGVLDMFAPLENQPAAIGGIGIAGAPQDIQFKVSEILAGKE